MKSNKPRFNEKRVLKEIKRSFPSAKIVLYKKLDGGLVSPVYRVDIIYPKRKLVVKIYKSKNERAVRNSNKIVSFLYEKNFPVPKIYSDRLFAKQGVVVMDYLKGLDALEFYNSSSQDLKKEILINFGKLIRRLHNLEIPSFWIHHSHEIKDRNSWVIWIKERINKYLKFLRKKLSKVHFELLKRRFKELEQSLSYKLDFVCMHWDAHLSNILVNSKGKIVGFFDFDNALKGDSLAELGQVKYWLRFRSKDYDNFKYFLKGYGKNFSKKELRMIDNYMLLHLAAVTRSIWDKQPRLTWIMEEHKDILQEFINK